MVISWDHYPFFRMNVMFVNINHPLIAQKPGGDLMYDIYY